MDTRTDAQVIAAYRDDPHEFATVFDRHYDAVYWYLARRVGPDLANDLASATFTTALDVRRRYDLSKPDARPWLLGIATNLVRHQRRGEARRLNAYARIDHSPDADIDVAGIVDRLDAARVRSVIAEALSRIPARDRDALLLFAWADLSYEEIAVALRIPVGTVRSRLHRVRRRLRELLGASGQSMVDETITEVLPADG